MTEPTDNELDIVLSKHRPAFATVGTLPLIWIRAAFREAIAKWGAPPQISESDTDYWVRNRALILQAIEDRGFRLVSSGGLFWLHGPSTQAQAVAVPTREFLERTLAAMEGVIDVAARKTDEFDALRSCVIDLTLMLFSDAKRHAKEADHEL